MTTNPEKNCDYMLAPEPAISYVPGKLYNFGAKRPLIVMSFRNNKHCQTWFSKNSRENERPPGRIYPKKEDAFMYIETIQCEMRQFSEMCKFLLGDRMIWTPSRYAGACGMHEIELVP